MDASRHVFADHRNSFFLMSCKVRLTMRIRVYIWLCRMSLKQLVTPVLIDSPQEVTCGRFARNSTPSAYRYNPGFSTYRFNVPLLRVGTKLLKGSRTAQTWISRSTHFPLSHCLRKSSGFNLKEDSPLKTILLELRWAWHKLKGASNVLRKEVVDTTDVVSTKPVFWVVYQFPLWLQVSHLRVGSLIITNQKLWDPI